MQYDISERCVEIVKRHEGFVPHAYRDVKGVPTIGWGFTRYFHRYGAPAVQMGDFITDEEGEFALRFVLKSFMEQVSPYIKVDLTRNQFNAIASLVYNIGVGAFINSTLLVMLNAGDYAGASAQISRWNKSGGRVIRGLTSRRAAERELFDTADYE